MPDTVGTFEYVDTAPDGYQPGVCNIGPAEIRRRRQFGYLGIAGSVALGGLLVVVNAPPMVRLLVALPAAAGLEGLIQARLRFCAGYGMAGLRNLGELGEAESVEGAQARAADRRGALRIHALSLAGGVAAGVAFALLARRGD